MGARAKTSAHRNEIEPGAYCRTSNSGHADETIDDSCSWRCPTPSALTSLHCRGMLTCVMLDWLVQAYNRGPSFASAIPFATAEAAIKAANAILLRTQHEKVCIYGAMYVDVRVELVVPTDDVVRLVSDLESRIRTAADATRTVASHKPSGPRH